VRAICERYGVPYNAGPLHKQFGSVVKKIFRLALPGHGGDEPAQEPVPVVQREREMAMAA
jgi:hypothetical protein